MPGNTKPLVLDVNAKPAPQYHNPATDAYEYLQGRNGAMRVELYGPNGQPIATSSDKLAVRAQEIEAILGEVAAAPTANTLADRLKQLADRLGEVSANPTANTALARLKALEGYLDGLEALLTTLNSKDFATQTTLAQLLAAVDGVEAGIGAPADAKADSGNGSLIALLKSLRDTGVKLNGSYAQLSGQPTVTQVRVGADPVPLPATPKPGRRRLVVSNTSPLGNLFVGGSTVAPRAGVKLPANSPPLVLDLADGAQVYAVASPYMPIVSVTSSGIALPIGFNKGYFVVVFTTGYSFFSGRPRWARTKDFVNWETGDIKSAAIGVRAVGIGNASMASPLVVAASDGAYRSDDSGATWVQISATTGLDLWDLTTAAFVNDLVVCGKNASGAKVWKVTSWNTLSEMADLSGGDTSSRVRCIEWLGSNTFVAFVESAGTTKIYRSTDAGVNWNLVTTASDVLDDISYGGSGLVVGITGSGKVYRSTDFGATWSGPITVHVGTSSQGSILAQSSTYVLAVAGSSRWSLYASEDGGQSWRRVYTPPCSSQNVGRRGLFAADDRSWVGTSEGWIFEGPYDAILTCAVWEQ